MNNEFSKGSNNSRVLAGLLLLIIGVLFFLKQAGFALFPYWLFTWPVFLIALGVFIGVKSNFRGAGWIVLLIIGSFFLLDDILNLYELRRYLVPAILVGVGLVLILRPRKFRPWRGGGGRWKNEGDSQPAATGFYAGPTGAETSSSQFSDPSADPFSSFEEKLDAAAVFGAVKKNILSKNFKGGEAVAVFGGCEIDLSRADINGTVKVEVTAVMGGIKLIVPSHWTIKQEVAAVFGGVEDKRDTHGVIAVQNKVLILEGTAFLGGIEIKSYK
jgi:predicted membrane protein